MNRTNNYYRDFGYPNSAPIDIFKKNNLNTTSGVRPFEDSRLNWNDEAADRARKSKFRIRMAHHIHGALHQCIEFIAQVQFYSPKDVIINRIQLIEHPLQEVSSVVGVNVAVIYLLSSTTLHCKKPFIRKPKLAGVVFQWSEAAVALDHCFPLV